MNSEPPDRWAAREEVPEDLHFNAQDITWLLMGLQVGLQQYPCLNKRELPQCHRVKDDLGAINMHLIEHGGRDGELADEAVENLITRPEHARTINTAYGILQYLRTHEKSVVDISVEVNSHIGSKGEEKLYVFDQFANDFNISRGGTDPAAAEELTRRTRDRNTATGRTDPPPALRTDDRPKD